MKKTILITGASRGIGKSIALFFAAKGWNLILCCHTRQDALKQVCDEAASLGADCVSLVGDVSAYNFCETLFSCGMRRFGRIDVVINNAGISHIGLLQDMSIEEWNQMLQTNLTSVFSCSKLAIPIMLAQGSGRIINISSVWGVCGASCEVAYSATKGGIHALTRALAKELAPSHISVNAIACGAIDTEMNQWLSEEERTALEQEIPAGRMGQTEEVAKLVYQLSTAPDYLTGQVISLDGGWV